MTRFICSSDNKNMARLIFHVLQPEALRCSNMLKNLRSPDMTVQFYFQWAHWSWMDTAKAHVLRLQDLVALERMGFNMDVSRTSVEAEIAWQDSLAGHVCSLLMHTLHNRAVRSCSTPMDSEQLLDLCMRTMSAGKRACPSFRTCPTQCRSPRSLAHFWPKP